MTLNTFEQRIEAEHKEKIKMFDINPLKCYNKFVITFLT